METADLNGIPLKSVMGPINYRPLKAVGESRAHSGAPQTPNKYSKNQIGNSCAVEGGREAAGAERHGAPRCRLRYPTRV